MATIENIMYGRPRVYTPPVVDLEHVICAGCGHYAGLHDGLRLECAACSDPTIPIEKRCPGFRAGE